MDENKLVCFRPWNAGPVSAPAEGCFRQPFEGPTLRSSRLSVSVFSCPRTLEPLNPCTLSLSSHPLPLTSHLLLV